MIDKDSFGLILGLASAGIATYAALISRVAVQKQLYTIKWNTNHDLHARARGMLIDNPNLLALHLIDMEELAKDGISCEELVYIVHHIDAGSAFHRLGGDQQIELTPFRKKFLENPKVRLAWKKYLRDKMFNPWAYSKALDDCISEIEARNPSESSA